MRHLLKALTGSSLLLLGMTANAQQYPRYENRYHRSGRTDIREGRIGTTTTGVPVSLIEYEGTWTGRNPGLYPLPATAQESRGRNRK